MKFYVLKTTGNFFQKISVVKMVKSLFTVKTNWQQMRLKLFQKDQLKDSVLVENKIADKMKKLKPVSQKIQSLVLRVLENLQNYRKISHLMLRVLIQLKING